MTSLFEGCGTEDGRIAPAHAPDDMDGDRRAMTLPGLLGAWLRRLRSPVFRPGSSRPGGAPRRGLLPVALPCLSFATVLAGAAAAQEVSLSESRYGVWEGNSVVIGVGIDNPKPTAFTLDYTLSGGTASGADVAGGFGTRSITVPENAKTASISIATVQDSIRDEGTETFSVQLSTSEPGIVFGRGTAEVSISDDDTTPTSTFESTSSSANEGAGTHHVTVRLSPAPTTNIKLAIQYALQPPRIRHPRLHDGGTATPGSDYVMPHSRSYSYGEFSYVAVPAGATTVTVPVTIVDDNDLEGDETVVLRYYGTAPERDHRGRYLVRSRTPHRRHTLTIVDNEPRVSFASASQRVSEGSGTRNVGVTLSPAPTTDVTFTYTVGGTATAGSDFTIADSGTVTVPKGATTATIPVTVIDDTAPESNETVLLTLAASGGYQVASPGTHTLTIVDNEQTVSFASASQRVGEGSGTHNVGVTLLPAREGFARIINHSHRSGTVRIMGTDDEGRGFGPVTLSLSAREAAHFNSDDLEEGNSKGLSGGLGDGTGNWRLSLQSDLDLEVGAYIRSAGGFLSSVHDVAGQARVEGEMAHHVPIFNPGSNLKQVSRLRLVNLTERNADVRIRGRDDSGRWAPGGEVELTLPAGGARQVSAQELEAGGADLTGRLGDGEGKWQLFVSADADIEVLSLMSTPTGHLTNLSMSGLRDTDESDKTSPPAEGSTFRDCAGCPEMVVVPAGSYPMGSPADEAERDADEGPVHQVTIGEPFAVGRYEVTFAEWDACRADGGCSHRPDDQGWGRGKRPVVDVSWNDAQEYMRWLSGETGRSYRLPSEAEWEYVARAGTTTRYWWGDAIGRNRANCDGCGSRWDARQTAPVGSFSSNAFGLYDVHGNVWERVQDCWNDSYAGAPDDGNAWEAGECGGRVFRGGGWQSLSRYSRAANRGQTAASSRDFSGTETGGFRVVRSLSAPMRHALALFRPAGHAQQGFARIINRSHRAGTVRIWGTDDAGDRRGPISLWLEAGVTRHFNSDDLEAGNPGKGLSGSLGNGVGDWRLELVSDLDVEPSAYIRTPDGFLTAMHAVAHSVEVEDETVHQVPIFNPGSNRNQVSWLRLSNLGDSSVRVTISGRDDAGQSAPLGEVRLTLPAHGARRISAQQLESGAVGLTGRIGDGKGKWQLLVTADGTIEVMSLLQSPTGHLSNLSTTSPADFVIAASGSRVVRPLHTISLNVPGGLGESDYLVFMDLSGTGRFHEDDTVEVEGFTTNREEILFASPLTQTFPETNTSHGLAVRVKRITDGQVSNVLHYSIEAISIPSHLSGYSSIALDVILKSLYTSADDLLLNAEAPSIQLGTTVAAARALGLDTELSDVYSEAILQSLFGVSVTEWAQTAKASTAITHRSDTRLGEGSKQNLTHFLTTEFSKDDQVDSALMQVGRCVSDAITRISSDSGNDEPDTCNVREIGGKMLEGVAERTNRFTAFIMKLPRKFISRFVPKSSLQAVYNVNAVTERTVQSMKAVRALNELPDVIDSGRDFVEDATGKLRLTREGLAKNFGSGLGAAKGMVRLVPGLLQQAQEDAAHENFGVEERNAFWTIANESDRRQREIDAVERLEDVYTGEETPQEAVVRNPDLGSSVVGNGCKAGYREFVVDADTSTCVFESLVEPNCYAGSRKVPGLAGVDVCLYFSLDFFQPDGSCRENYSRVRYQGRWTCRWKELGPNEPAWYVLFQVPDDGGRLPSHFGPTCVSVEEGPVTFSQCAATVTNNCAEPMSGSVFWFYSVEPSETCRSDAYWAGYVMDGFVHLHPGESRVVHPTGKFTYCRDTATTCLLHGVCVGDGQDCPFDGVIYIP